MKDKIGKIETKKTDISRIRLKTKEILLEGMEIQFDTDTEFLHDFIEGYHVEPRTNEICQNIKYQRKILEQFKEEKPKSDFRKAIKILSNINGNLEKPPCRYAILQTDDNQIIAICSSNPRIINFYYDYNKEDVIENFNNESDFFRYDNAPISDAKKEELYNILIKKLETSLENTRKLKTKISKIYSPIIVSESMSE